MVADEIASMPSSDEVAGVLEALPSGADVGPGTMAGCTSPS